MNMYGLKISALLLVLFAAPSVVLAAETGDCHVGSYKLADGSLVDVAPGDDDGALRWTRFDGTTGQLHPSAAGKAWSSTAGWSETADGMSVSFPDCDSGNIDFNGVSGRRIPSTLHARLTRGNPATTCNGSHGRAPGLPRRVAPLRRADPSARPAR
jgi:hypothetical protein